VKAQEHVLLDITLAWERKALVFAAGGSILAPQNTPAQRDVQNNSGSGEGCWSMCRNTPSPAEQLVRRKCG